MVATTETHARGRGGAPLRERSAAFLDYLDSFVASLDELSLEALIGAAGGPEKVAIIAVDVVNGFCVEGPLASERVAAIVAPIRRLLEAAHARGVRQVAVLRDSHTPEAPEFAQFGPHCIAGTAESQLVRELADLPFASTFQDVPKNATSAWSGEFGHAGLGMSGEGRALGSETLRDWVERREAAGVRTFVVVGDCTDLCVYQTAMPLKLSANARNRKIEVVVPAECVDTYDLPVETARQIGATPHDADFLHAVFLYHLALNGVRVARSIRD